jgi:hypothetical protein
MKEIPFPILLFILVALIVFFVTGLFVLFFVVRRMENNHYNAMQEQYADFKKHIENQNKAFTESITKTIADQQQSLSNYQHLEKNLFNTFIKLRSAIKENCTATMNDINASRLAIYLFHNGTCSTHGISFFKMSCICEKVAIGSGIRERLIDHSNIPINLFDAMIDKLITNGRYVIMNDENLDTSSHKIFISSDKIKYAQCTAIFDNNNNILGFVLAEMDHPYDRKTALDENEKMMNLVSQLVPILSYSDYVNTTIEATKQHE